MTKKKIKCVDTRTVYKHNDDNPYGITTYTATYDDGSTELFPMFRAPVEIELFCGKACYSITETANETERVVHVHHEGRRPYFNRGK
jgi:hypothetical protein